MKPKRTPLSVALKCHKRQLILSREVWLKYLKDNGHRLLNKTQTPTPVIFMLFSLVHLLPQMLPGSRNVGHVFIQDVLLGADAVILNVLGPVQLAHVEVKHL